MYRTNSLKAYPSIPCVLVTVNLSKKPLHGPGEKFESETAFGQFWKDHGLLSSATGNLVKTAFSDKPSTVLLRRFYVNKLN